MNKQAYFKMMFPGEMSKKAAENVAPAAENKMYLQIDPRDVGRAEYNKHRFAGITNAALVTALATLIGYSKGQTEKQQQENAIKGLLGGAGISLGSHILGTLAGKIAGPRKAIDEISYLNESTPSNYFIPGVAAFNKARSKDTKRIFEQNAPFSAVSAIMGK